MTSSPKHGNALSDEGLRQFVDRALSRGFYREAWHSETERASRNISDEDISFGLERKSWTLAKAPDFDADHGTWEYLIKTEDIEGEELHLKIAVYPDEQRFVVVTKF
jgi:hypothetical protein